MSLRGRIAPAFDLLGALDPLAKIIHKRSLAILTYHRVAVPGTHKHLNDRVISTTPEEFDEQMRWISRIASPIGFDDLARIENEKGEIPPRAVLVTFDDGYLDNYLHAFPTLRRYRIPATIFLVTGLVGSQEPFWWDLVTFVLERSGVQEVEAQGELERLKHMRDEERKEAVRKLCSVAGLDVRSLSRSILNWEEISEMASEGVSFGGHSVNHPILSKLNQGEVRSEVTECKRTLEERLGRPVLAFAYPVGRAFSLNDEVVKEVREAGYRYAVTTEVGVNRKGGWDPYRLRRIGITLHDSIPRFKAKFAAPWFFAR
ncbi:MAG: polysaccharide deacetylase family protein [Pseudomonadota bacterium]